MGVERTSGSDVVVCERPKTELKWSDHAGVETGSARLVRLVMATGVVNVLAWLAWCIRIGNQHPFGRRGFCVE